MSTISNETSTGTTTSSDVRAVPVAATDPIGGSGAAASVLEPRLPDRPPESLGHPVPSATMADPVASASTPGEREPTARQLLRPFWFVGALLMMLDGLTTYIALEYFGNDGAREGNPIGVWVIDQIGVAGMCAGKVLIGVLMMWSLAATADHGHRVEWLNRGLRGRRPRWKVQRNAAWTLAFSLVLMGVVVGNNLRAIVSLWGQ